MKIFAKLFLVLISSVQINIFSQIPNPGFENWINENIPQDWDTNNLPSSWITVSRSSSAHTGSFAAKLQVADFGGFPIFPVSTSKTFLVNQTYGSIMGHYQLQPINVAADVVLTLTAYFFEDGLYVGSGAIDLADAASSYLPFSFDLQFSDGAVPDSASITIQLVAQSSTEPGIGSFALIDDLNFGQSTDVKLIDQIPLDFSLKQNYPNPFNPSTRIGFSVAKTGNVELNIYNLLGKKVAAVITGEKSAGFHEVTFDASELPSGVYFYKLQSGNSVKTKKMLLLR